VNFEQPLIHAVVVESLDAARRSLAFTPRTPNFDQTPTLIQISDPSFYATPGERWLAIIYHLAPGTVDVKQHLPTQTQAELLATASRTDYPAGTFAVVPVGAYQGLLTKMDSGGVALDWIRDGVQYEVTGPALDASSALQLAGRI
jgi:hypothetical protein